MIKFFTKAILTSVSVLFADWLLDGITISGNNNTLTAMIVAVVLGLLNTFVRPLLVFLTIPFTVVTLGLFLFAINAFIVMWAAELVPNFKVSGWGSAFLFSLIVSLTSSFLERLINRYGKQPNEEKEVEV